MATIKSFTDVNQAKVLAKILPLESADNVIVSFGDRYGVKTVVMPKETLDVIRTPFADIRETTMCWSLAALLGVLPEKYTELIKEGGMYRIIIKDSYMTCLFENPVDACYELILKLHELKML